MRDGGERVRAKIEIDEESKEERKEDMETNGVSDRRTRSTRGRSSPFEGGEEQDRSADVSTEQLGRGLRVKRSRLEQVQRPRQQATSNRPRRSSQRLHSSGGAKEEWLGNKPAFVTAVEDDKEYTVERIIKESRDKYGKLWYFVKWLGWPEADNSWVREADMECEELLAAFKEEQGKRMEEIVERIRLTKQRNREEREQEWQAREEERRRQEEEQLKMNADDANMSVESEADIRRRSGRVRKPPPDPHQERQAALLLEPRRPQRSSKPAKEAVEGSMLGGTSEAADMSSVLDGEDRSLAEMLAERGWILSRPSPAQEESMENGIHEHDELVSDERPSGMEDDEKGDVSSGGAAAQSEVVSARVIASVDGGGSILFNHSVPSFASSLASAVSHFRSTAKRALTQSPHQTADGSMIKEGAHCSAESAPELAE